MILYRLSDGGEFITDATNLVVASKPAGMKTFQMHDAHKDDKVYVAGSVPLDKRKNWADPDSVFKHPKVGEHIVLAIYGERVNTDEGKIAYIDPDCKIKIKDR